MRGLDRRNPFRAAAAAGRAGVAVAAARKLLRARRADAVMGGGGYVAGPVGLAALSLGLPLVLTEADSHLGLTNRMLAGRARRVCLAFPIPGRAGERYMVTGRPIPPALLEADRGTARERFGIAAADRCLLIFGGSLGARTLNEAAVRAFGEAGGARHRDYHVLLIAGTRDHPGVRERLGDPPRFTLLEYEPNLGDALAACDLALARSGGSIFELTAAGRPAILVPYPYASADHQSRNAAWMAEAGAAVVIADADLGPEVLAAEVGSIFADPKRLTAMSGASAALAKPDAADRIAAEILSTTT